jgi:hypothetical protein
MLYSRREIAQYRLLAVRLARTRGAPRPALRGLRPSTHAAQVNGQARRRDGGKTPARYTPSALR